MDAVAVVSGGLAPVWRSGLQLVAELRDELLVLPTGVPGWGQGASPTVGLREVFYSKSAKPADLWVMRQVPGTGN